MSDSMLVIEDEPLLGAEIRRHYTRAGWEVTLVTTLADAQRELFQTNLEPLIVLADMNLPDGNSLDFLERSRQQAVGGEWIILTGYGTIADSVRGLRLGAVDFLEKPCEMQRLDMIVHGAARGARAQRRLLDEHTQQHRRYGMDSFQGTSAAARAVRDMLRRLTAVPMSTMLIAGETGTGKGLAARILHHSGLRQKGPMVEINCAALPRELLESELFGHEAGAYTGAKGRRRGLVEQAHGGTLFLDEIGEMPLDLQAKLLKVIEDRRLRRLGAGEEIAIDLQIIGASNQDLRKRVQNREFREDLYHRLTVFTLDLPSLRQRIEDIRVLVPAMLDEFNVLAGKAVKVVPEAAWSAMERYGWPGNVRELRNAVERCVLLAENAVFPMRWLGLPTVDDAVPAHIATQPARAGVLEIPLDGSVTLDEAERLIIAAALDKCAGNATAAARLLGSTRETMRYRIQKHGLTQRESESGQMPRDPEAPG